MTEKILWEGSPKMYKQHPMQFVLCLLLCLVGIGFLFLLFWWLQCKSQKLTVYESRVVLDKGLLSRTSSEVRCKDIRNIQVQQTFSQRIMKTGTIGISSAGQSNIEIEISGIENPRQVANLVRLQMN